MQPKALFVLAVLVAGSFAPRVWADDAKEADALAREGVELRRIGKDAQALPKFEQAYAKSKNARHLAQMGLCLQAVGRWSEAEESLSTALQDAGNTWIKSNREIIKESLETVKQHVGSLDLTGSPAGAAVLIDGRNVGTLPLPAPLRLNEGSIVLEVRAADHRNERQELTVQGGQFRKIQVELQRQVTAAVPTAPARAAEESAGSLVAPAAQEDSGGGSNTWLWVGAGALVVAAGVAAFFLLSSGGDAPKADGMGSL